MVFETLCHSSLGLAEQSVTLCMLVANAYSLRVRRPSLACTTKSPPSDSVVEAFLIRRTGMCRSAIGLSTHLDFNNVVLMAILLCRLPRERSCRAGVEASPHWLPHRPQHVICSQSSKLNLMVVHIPVPCYLRCLTLRHKSIEGHLPKRILILCLLTRNCWSWKAKCSR